MMDFFNATNFFSLNSSDDDLLLSDINVTTTTTQRTAAAAPVQLSYETAMLLDKMAWAFLYVINPSISIIGLAGNAISTVIISRDGLKKSSNVLLIAMALCDVFVLTGFIFIAIFNSLLNARFLAFGEKVNWFMFVLYSILRHVLCNVAFLTSYQVAVYITIERLCAVFFPLKFHLVVTSLRVLMVLIFTLAFYLGVSLFIAFQFTLGNPFFYRGKMNQAIRPSKFYYDYNTFIKIFNQIINELNGSVPIIIIILGSVVIGYKVKMAALRRAQMTSHGDPDRARKDASQSRTTRTLLAVSATFALFTSIVYVYDTVNGSLELNYFIRELGEQLSHFIYALNSSTNFFIYIVSNVRFRDQMVAMFTKGDNGKKLKNRASIFTSHPKN